MEAELTVLILSREESDRKRRELEQTQRAFDASMADQNPSETVPIDTGIAKVHKKMQSKCFDACVVSIVRQN